MDERMPSDPETGYLYFGVFTWKDLLRVGLPPGIAVWWLAHLEPAQPASVLGISTGILLGVVWYGVRPYDQPLEVHLYHKLRWLLTLEASS